VAAAFTRQSDRRCAAGERLRPRRCAIFLIHEFWDDETRALAGWAGHRFRKFDGVWRISAKQVNLLVCDQCIRNPSIIL